MDYDQLIILGISLGLGLLVGLQREYVDKKKAGIRTFSLLTLFGTISGMIAQSLDSVWILAAGLLGIAFLLGIANYSYREADFHSAGQTTEIAVLLMYALGAYLVLGNLAIGIAIGGATAILLHLKGSLGTWVHNLSEKDLRAIMQFAAISLVILPILPDKTFGPYDVFNPREVWWMVVLIVGISLIGYFIYKWAGTRFGTVASGILGGLISSTATTLSYSGISKSASGLARMVAFVIVSASGVALIRVLVEIAVVSAEHLPQLIPAFLAELGIFIIICLVLFLYREKKEVEEMPEPSNPAQLKYGLLFGFLYSIILVAVAAAKDYFGESGLWIVSIISGFTDVDAITLSLSNTLNRGAIDVNQARRFIMIAFLSNLVFKGGIVAFASGKKTRRLVLISFGITLVTGLLIVWLWPDS